MTFFDLIAILLVLTAALGWLNHRFIRLPQTIGLLVMGLVASLLLIALEFVFPNVHLYEDVAALVRRLDFQHTVLDGMLAFLLFAGGLHVDFSALRDRALSVASMATLGVIISTAIAGTGFWLIAGWLGLPISLPWALVFGALISPTDPVAVLSTLKTVRVPEELRTDMTGESLFNDGVGVVLFTALLTLALGSGQEGVDLAALAELFFYEALGGALLGLVAGYVAFRGMKAIDDYAIEILISLALVVATYALASRFHMSGPIAVVVAGLLIGNRGPGHAMGELTERYLFDFWTLIDELLNSILFLLVGLEVLVLRLDLAFAWIAASTIPLVLAARLVAVAVPVSVLRVRHSFAAGTVPILTWGGLRGGISVALALSIPEIPEKALILAATYTVVVFTIVVQGLTLKQLVRRYST